MKRSTKGGRIQAKKHHLKKPSHLIALGFGAGLVRNAPGSMGSAVALMLYAIFLHHLSTLSYITLIACGFGLGIVVCSQTARSLRDSDHPAIVWDEFIGMWAALIGVPYEWKWLVLAFVLFRLLDILKPPPLRALEKIPGGLGIMLDDLAAGLMTAVVLFFLVRYLAIWS
jgi:phosphatidylglycerophosphatase A